MSDLEVVAGFRDDPLGFVEWAWPEVELEDWQRGFLMDLGARVRGLGPRYG